MQELLSLNVKYTLKDMREYSFAKARTGINLAMFIACIVLTILIALAIMSIILVFPNTEERNIYIILMVILLLFFWSFSLLTPLISYLILRSYFTKNRHLEVLQRYRLFDDRLEIISEAGSFAIWWRDIYCIRELRPCFVIQPSSGKMYLLPRRCFESQEQLDLFMDIIKSRLHPGKLDLKAYRFKISSPDHGEIKNSECTGQTTEIKNETGVPIMEVQCSVSKNEYIALKFRRYYTQPAGLLTIAIGILCIYTSIRNLSLGISNSIVTLGLGVIFTFVIPLKLYFDSTKSYESDAAIQKPYTIKFFDEYYVIEHPNGASKTLYSDLIRVKEEKTAILLFVSTNLAHTVPKKAFEGREDELKALEDLLRQRARMK